jgi:hypothetical protein
VVAPQTGAPVNLAETKEFNTEWGSKKRGRQCANLASRQPRNRQRTTESASNAIQ